MSPPRLSASTIAAGTVIVAEMISSRWSHFWGSFSDPQKTTQKRKTHSQFPFFAFCFVVRFWFPDWGPQTAARERLVSGSVTRRFALLFGSVPVCRKCGW